jgi:glycine/D-amino acid oxidase-like deaminating enzyme
MRIIVAGAGIFGLTAAHSLAARGHAVTVYDPGPVPHPLAESTDISKVVRADYGADEELTALAERSIEGWRAWNQAWGEELFHETGVAFFTRAPMAAGGFEHESHALLTRRGHKLERLGADEIAKRFPAFRPGVLVDGYVNPLGGWVESGKVVSRLYEIVKRTGVTVENRRIAHLLAERDRIAGVVLTTGGFLEADCVVVAAGAWTHHLVPQLKRSLRTVGQPVFHLKPADPAPFRAPHLPVFGADIARTGYYGFPAQDGVVKIANHGPGRVLDPNSAERVVSPAEEASLRAFLGATLPGLAEAPISHRRICVYCDTHDESFWLARDPHHGGLVVATGGSGHGFKFAPVLGDLIADAVEGAANPLSLRFRWRPEETARTGQDAARHRV